MKSWLNLKKNNWGVTLYELLAVIVIVGIMASVTYATYTRQAQKNQRKEAVKFIHSLLDGARLYDMQHPPSLTGDRTHQDWIENWKTYLVQYATREFDYSPPNSPILLTGPESKRNSYFFDEVDGKLHIYANYSNIPVYDYVTWDGQIGEESGGGVECAANAECFSDFCTTATCVDGTCQYAPLTCDDGNECTADSCDDAIGCVFDPGPRNGETCDDGNQCTNNGTCNNGVCEPGNNLPDNTPCDDGNLCTLNDKCLSGACLGSVKSCVLTIGTPICQRTSCNPDTGNCDLYPGNNTSCDDGDPCSDPDYCDGAGNCIGSSPPCN